MTRIPLRITTHRLSSGSGNSTSGHSTPSVPYGFGSGSSSSGRLNSEYESSGSSLPSGSSSSASRSSLPSGSSSSTSGSGASLNTVDNERFEEAIRIALRGGVGSEDENVTTTAFDQYEANMRRRRLFEQARRIEAERVARYNEILLLHRRLFDRERERQRRIRNGEITEPDSGYVSEEEAWLQN
jgi:hypothetical protein